MAWYRAGGGGIPSSLKTGMNSVLNKKFGTSTTYDPAGWPDDVNLLGKLPEKTVSGAIANITDGADEVPLKELVFSASPVQAAGTPSPSNPLPISGHTEMNGVHTGKNLLDPSKKTEATATIWRFYLTDGLLLKKGTYTISASAIMNGIYVRKKADNTDVAVSYNQSYLTFTLSDDLLVVFTYSNVNSWDGVTFQLEVGNQQTAHVAYQTPETKKWSFPPFGKNLIDDKKKLFLSKNIVIGRDSGTLYDKTLTLKAGTYTLSIQTADNAYTNIYCYDVNAQSQVSGFPAYSTMEKTFTLESDTDVSFYVYKSTYESTSDIISAQLEAGSSATSYEPYQSMFDGSVNALTGEVESIGKLFDMGILTWYADSNRTGLFYTGLIPNAAYTECAVMCEQFLVNNTKNPNTISDYEMSSMNSYGSNRIFIKNTAWDGYTGSQVASALSGIKVLLKLASPIEIDMDSVDWQTQLGDNNFFNDCGETEVTYRADIDLALGGN